MLTVDHTPERAKPHSFVHCLPTQLPAAPRYPSASGLPEPTRVAFWSSTEAMSFPLRATLPFLKSYLCPQLHVWGNTVPKTGKDKLRKARPKCERPALLLVYTRCRDIGQSGRQSTRPPGCPPDYYLVPDFKHLRMAGSSRYERQWTGHLITWAWHS